MEREEDADYDIYDEPITKRYLVQIASQAATEEELDAALRALIPGNLDDAEHRRDLIDLIYNVWEVRLRLRKQHRPGAGVTWRDVQQMFDDIQAAVGITAKKPRTRRQRDAEVLNFPPTGR